MKDYIKFAIGFTAFLLIYGTAGALELDIITTRQAIIRFVAIFSAVIIGAVIAAIKQERKEKALGKRQLPPGRRTK